MRLLRAIRELIRAVVDHELEIRGYWTEAVAIEAINMAAQQGYNKGYEQGRARALKQANEAIAVKYPGAVLVDTNIERMGDEVLH